MFYWEKEGMGWGVEWQLSIVTEVKKSQKVGRGGGL